MQVLGIMVLSVLGINTGYCLKRYTFRVVVYSGCSVNQ